MRQAHQLFRGFANKVRLKNPVFSFPKLTNFVFAVVVMGVAVGLTWGQSFPRPRLETVTPPGGQVGTSVEVTLDGDDLDEIEELYVSDSRIKVEKLPDPPVDPKKKKNPPPPPIRFKLTIPGNMPVGVYDVRAIGKWGISNPRAFVVGDLKEIMEKENNNDVPEAQEVEINTTVNGVVNNRTDVDYFKFKAKKGQRIVIHCAGFSIDSMLNPLLELYNAKGMLLANNRNYQERDAVLDYPIPEEGEYYVRLCQFAYVIGGKQTFYRLTTSTAPWIDAAYPPVVQVGKSGSVTLYGKNLPGGNLDNNVKLDGRPLEKAVVNVNPPMDIYNSTELSFSGLLPPRSGTVEGFEYRVKNSVGHSNPVLMTFSKVPVQLDNGKNNTMEMAQPINLPGTICGRIEELGDEDWYKFSAKKGEVYTIEGVADRLGIPVNLYCLIKRADNGQVVETVESHPEIPSSTNDNFTFFTEDPKGRFVVPADGDYYLLANTHTSYSRSGPRFIYQVTLRPEEPDFRVLLVSNNTPNIGGFTMYQGTCQEMKVVLFRQDRFDGEVLLEAEGLPSGVTCTPQVIGPRLKEAVLVLEAANNAKPWAGDFKIKATAEIDGKKVIRMARVASLVWPSPNNVPSISRLSRSVCLAVRGQAPYTLDTDVEEIEVPVGGQGEIKIKANRQWDEAKKAQIQLVRIAAPAGSNGQPINFPNVNIKNNQNEGVIKYNIPNNAIPGTYTLVFQGRAKYSIYPDPKNKKKKQNVDDYVATPPIKMVVYDKVAQVELPNQKISVKQGEEVDLVVRLKRLYDYKGEFQVQLDTPGGTSGISSSTVKIAKNGNEAKLKIKVAKNAKVLSRPDFKVSVTARVGNVTFTHEAQFEMSITKAAASNTPARSPALTRLTQLEKVE